MVQPAAHKAGVTVPSLFAVRHEVDTRTQCDWTHSRTASWPYPGIRPPPALRSRDRESLAASSGAGPTSDPGLANGGIGGAGAGVEAARHPRAGLPPPRARGRPPQKRPRSAFGQALHTRVQLPPLCTVDKSRLPDSLVEIRVRIAIPGTAMSPDRAAAGLSAHP